MEEMVKVSTAVSEAKRTPTRFFLSTIVLASICFGVGIAGKHAVAQVSEGISQPTTLRVEDAVGWWPTKGTGAKEQFVGNAACIRCHSDKSVSYAGTAMAHAAVSAEDSEVARTHDVLRLEVG